MKDRKTGNNQYLKEMNKSIVLDIIRTTNGVSRKALADITGLSATASGTIVKSLLDEEYIWEKGEGESSGGRKPVMLELKPGSYYSLGFDIDVRYVYTELLDITGNVLYRNKRVNQSGFSSSQAVDIITEEYGRALKNLNIPEKRILGIGVSIPGMVDLKTRNIVLAPNLGWKDVELLSPLQLALNNSVYLENESMCSASCENWLGLCRDIDDFVCINIDSGIGAGLFLRGKMYRGFSGSAGEVGHIHVDENGPPCKCGNIGCLETFASISGMIARSASLNNTKEEPTFELLLDNAEKGDQSSLKVFHDAAVSLGKAIAYIINTLNTQKIVLGKRFPEYSHLVIDTIREAAGRYALKYPSKHTEIVTSHFGEDSSALGAAIIPIRKLFGR